MARGAGHEDYAGRLMSTTGMPSTASMGPTRRRVPEISRRLTRCNLSGFGGS